MRHTHNAHPSVRHITDEFGRNWPIPAGGSDDDGSDDPPDGTDDADDDPPPAPDPEGAEHLGDPGKKALDAMKSKWRTERDQRKDLEQQIADLKAEAAEGDDPDPDAIREAAKAEARAELNERLVAAEVRAAAAGKLNDPADAAKFLDLSKVDVDGDGNVDADELADMIDQLVEDKPYLAAQSGQRFQGDGDGGARKDAGRPSQLTRDDLKRMSPEEIVKAKKDGQLDALLGRDNP